MVEYGEMAEWSNAADSVIYGTRSGQLCKKQCFLNRLRGCRSWLNMERWQSGRMRQTRSFMEREAVNSVKKQCFFKQIERLSLLVEYGEMAEWSNAADSKSVVRFFRTVSSNLTLSAIR